MHLNCSIRVDMLSPLPIKISLKRAMYALQGIIFAILKFNRQLILWKQWLYTNESAFSLTFVAIYIFSVIAMWCCYLLLQMYWINELAATWSGPQGTVWIQTSWLPAFPCSLPASSSYKDTSSHSEHWKIEVGYTTFSCNGFCQYMIITRAQIGNGRAFNACCIRSCFHFQRI